MAQHPHEHRTSRRLLRWLPALLWAAVIFAGSSVPGRLVPGRFAEAGHLSEYAVLGGLLVVAMWRGRPEDAGCIAWTALGLCALYALSDEFHQAFVPMRTPDPLDWATDLVGASVGLAVVLMLSARAAIRRPSGQFDASPDEPRASSGARSR